MVCLFSSETTPQIFIIAYRKLLIQPFFKIYVALHPDISLEPSAFFRFTQKILLIDTDIKDHIVAGKSHKIQFFIRIFIDCLFHIFYFTHDLVLVTFHALGHHKRIDHREKILFLDSLGNHGIRIHIVGVIYSFSNYRIFQTMNYVLVS